MLIYYFGSKERLIIEVLECARARQQAGLTMSEGLPSDEVLRRYWKWATTPSSRPYLSLLYQVYGLALHDRRFRNYYARESLDWIRFCDEGLRKVGVPEDHLKPLSTYLVANVRGLELDLLATGDMARVQQGFETFLDDLEHRVSRCAQIMEVS